MSGPGIVSAHHPHAIMKQTFSFPLGFSMQLWLAVPCNSELLLEHLFTVGRFSLLHFNKFGINLCTIFPQNVSQILAWQLRNVGWFFPCPKRASVCVLFRGGDVSIFACSELKLQLKCFRPPHGNREGGEHNRWSDVTAFSPSCTVTFLQVSGWCPQRGLTFCACAFLSYPFRETKQELCIG